MNKNCLLIIYFLHIYLWLEYNINYITAKSHSKITILKISFFYSMHLLFEFLFWVKIWVFFIQLAW